MAREDYRVRITERERSWHGDKGLCRGLRPLANIPLPGPPFHIVSGRVGTACQPSCLSLLSASSLASGRDSTACCPISRAPPAGRGATASRPFADRRPNLNLTSRAPPAGRGAIYLALLIITRARQSHVPTIPPILYTPANQPPRGLRPRPPFHLCTGHRPICTFARLSFRPPSSVIRTL
jgi:hypothetical protein